MWLSLLIHFHIPEPVPRGAWEMIRFEFESPMRFTYPSSHALYVAIALDVGVRRIQITPRQLQIMKSIDSNKVYS